jgi:hypothetical protein
MTHKKQCRKADGAMKRNKRIVLLMLFSFFLCLCSHIYCVFIYEHQPSSISKNVQKGVPYVFQSDEDYFGNIKLSVTDDYVYILFGGKAIVKVFRHDGAYIGSIAIYKGNTGAVQMKTDHDRAYIEHNGCLYEFDGIDFIRCYTKEKGDFLEKRDSIKNIVIPSGNYSCSFGNVIKYKNTPQEYVFLRRGLLHRIAYPGVLLPAEVAVVLLWIFLPELWNKLSKRMVKQHGRQPLSSP